MDEYMNHSSSILFPLKEDIISILKKHNAILAGGAITNYFSGIKLPDSDYDFFFTNENEAIDASIALKHEVPPLDYIETDRADTLVYKDGLVQIIYTVFGTPQEIIDSFDFSVVKGAYCLSTGQWVFGKNFHNDIKKKIVRVERWKDHPCLTVARMIKYHDRKKFKLIESDLIKLGILLQVKEKLSYTFKTTTLEKEDEGVDYKQFIITNSSSTYYLNKWLKEVEDKEKALPRLFVLKQKEE